MTRIVFCFAGTGDPGTSFAEHIERVCAFDDKVIRIYLQGCHHPMIGGGAFFPNFDLLSTKIYSAFKKDQILDLEKLQKLLGDGISQMDNLPAESTQPKITNIALYGYSRGALTCFAVAKKLNDLKIPIDIIANQPVPGQHKPKSYLSLYPLHRDLRHCQHIRSATTLLASYNLENGLIQNQFYQQMLALFSPQTITNNWLLPHQTHFEWCKYWLVPHHIKLQLSRGGYLKLHHNSYECEMEIKYAYNIYTDLCFTPAEFSQKIFGEETTSFSKDPLYLEVMQALAQEQLEDLEDQENLSQSLSDEQALNIDRRLKRRAMELITNEILHASILGLVVNLINQKKPAIGSYSTKHAQPAYLAAPMRNWSSWHNQKAEASQAPSLLKRPATTIYSCFTYKRSKPL